MSVGLASKPAGPRVRPEDAPGLRHTFVVVLAHGLHARPCAALVKALQPFTSSVVVEANGQTASGHSVLGLMALAAGCGASISFLITGDDATAAMAAVRHLFETDFAEAHLPAPVEASDSR